jgi:hypothetical protein
MIFDDLSPSTLDEVVCYKCIGFATQGGGSGGGPRSDQGPPRHQGYSRNQGPLRDQVSSRSQGGGQGSGRGSGEREAELKAFQETIDKNETSIFVVVDRVPNKMHDMIDKEASNCHNPSTWYIEPVDKWPSVAEQYKVHTIPTTIFFFGGKEVGRVTGRDEEAIHQNFLEHCHRDDGAHDRDCLTIKQFDKDVASYALVVVLYYAKGTQAADMLLPAFRKAQNNCPVRAKFMKYDRIINSIMADHLKVQQSPTVLFYVNGERNYVEPTGVKHFQAEMTKYAPGGNYGGTIGFGSLNPNKMPWEE